MKHFLAAFFLLFIVASPAVAEVITVRSGEHADFTRVVLYLPRPLDWTLETQNTKANVAFTQEKITFNLESAFEKISRARVLSMTPVAGKSALQFDLNCNCAVTSFLHTSTMLVIDISDETAEIQSEIAAQDEQHASPTIQMSPEREQTTNNPNPIISTRTMSRFKFQAGEIVLPEKPRVNDFHLGFGVALQGQSSPSSPVAQTDEEDLARLKRVKDAEQRLIEQIGRAATQGLLSIRRTQIELPSSSENPPHDQVSVEERPIAELERPSSPLANVNLRAESSIDRSLMQIMGSSPQTRNGEFCLTDAELAIHTWGNEDTFGTQLGRYRARLVGEFDQPNSKAALGLTKLYIYFGFGAEALHSIEMATVEDTDKAILLSLSRIMETGYDPVSGPLHGQLECDTAAAFWSAMAYPQLPPSAEINVSAILRTLNTIPLHLRVHLGPILSERLVLAGENKAAESVLRILDRGMETPDARVHMAEATLELAEGNLEAATHSLDAVVTANTEMSPEALVHLIDTRLTMGEAIPPHIADLAGAFAHERREEKIGQDLRRVHILALADAARFKVAMQELSRFKTHKSLTGYRDLRSKTIEILTEKADDLTFLEFALLQSHETPELIDPAIANSVASRLLNIGFSKPAAAFIQATSEGSVGRERRILRAQLALSEGRPRRAEVEILGLNGPRINLLRAQARSMAGDHQAAQNFYSTLAETEAEDTEAWLAEDWDHLTSIDDPVISAVAQLMILRESAESSRPIDPQDPAPTIGVLAQNRELLEASLQTREALDALLETMAVEDLIAQPTR